MSILSAVKAILDADATLLAIAVGGVWDFTETGRMGINRTATPAAFDAAGIIKPCILVNERAPVPDGILNDDNTQYTSARQVVEIWCYEDSGYTNIEAMRNRCYVLLHAKIVPGTFRVQWAGDITRQHDTQLDASVERSDYQAIFKRSVP